MAHSTAWWFLLLLSFLQPSRFTSAAQIKLRSTVIDTRYVSYVVNQPGHSAVCRPDVYLTTDDYRHVSQRARKLMDGTVQHQPHVHEDWGVLHSMSQILVTMIPERTHEQQLALEQDIERAGGYVSSYLPDDTWLVIGNDRVAQVARAAPLVHWVVRCVLRRRVCVCTGMHRLCTSLHLFHTGCIHAIHEDRSRMEGVARHAPRLIARAFG